MDSHIGGAPKGRSPRESTSRRESDEDDDSDDGDSDEEEEDDDDDDDEAQLQALEDEMKQADRLRHLCAARCNEAPRAAARRAPTRCSAATTTWRVRATSAH